MATEKKVVFSAQNNVSQTARQIYNEADAAAKKQSASLKEQNSLIAAQIKLLEKKAQLEAASGASSVKSMFKEANNMASGQGQQSARIAARQAESSLNQKTAEGAEIITILKAIHSEERKSNSTAEKTEKSSQKKAISSEEQYQAMRSLARQEVKENRSGVKGKIAAAEKDDYAGMDPRSAEKLMYQKQLMGDDKKSSGVFGQVFAGTLVAGIVQQIASTISNLSGAGNGDQAFNQLLGIVPVAGHPTAAIMERSREQQYQVQTKSLELSARTGRGTGIGIGKNPNTSLGYSTLESLGISSGLIGAAGNANGANQTGGAMLLNRGMGLPIDVLTQIVKDQRLVSKSSDVTKIVADVIKANPELRNDQTKSAEILGQTSQLINDIASKAEGVTNGSSIGIVGALRSVGGNLGNQNSGALMSQINGSLSNPGNDFQKSLNFGALNTLHPGKSYWQLREEQEKGLGAKGLIGARLRQMEAMGGGGENLIGQISTAFFGGQNVGTSRKIAEAYKKNPNMFDNYHGNSNEDLAKFVDDLNGKAKKNTSGQDVSKAIIDEGFLKGPIEGMTEILKQTKDSAERIGKEIIEAILNPKQTPEEKAKWESAAGRKELMSTHTK
jgi:hypothetical protein